MSIHTPLGWGALVVFVCTLHAPDAYGSDDPTVLSADQAVALALAANPRIREADATLLSARAQRSSAAVFLSNPSVSGWATPDLERASLDASQPLSLTGEGWHARASARHGLRQAELLRDRARREIAADTRRAWLDASVAGGRVEVAAEGAALAERLEYGVSRRFEEGEASELEVRLARLAHVQAVVRLLEARREQAQAIREVARWTLQSIAPEDIPPDPLQAAPAPSNAPFDERSDVTAARRALDAARAQLTRQRAAVVPPISVGFGLDVEDGSTFVGPSLGVTLPLFDRNQRGRAAARGSLAVRESELDTVVAIASTERETATTRVDEATQLSARFGGDLLDEARAALASIEAGVLAGEIDLSTAVLLQTQVLAGETAIVSMRGLVASARIDLLLATDDDALLGGAP